MEAINYLGLGLRDNLQIGSDTAAGEEINLNDGLSLDELKIIDNNGDGQITLEEFQNSYGSNTEKAKEIYQKTLNWLNSTVEKNDDGTTVITQKTNDSSVKSTYDKNGELKSYISITNDSSKAKKIIEECTIDGKARNKNIYTQSLDGKKESEFKDGELEGTTIEKNNIKVSHTIYNRIIQVQDDKDNVTFTYSNSGTIASAKVQIGDKEYEGNEISYLPDSDTYVIKNDKGKIVASKTEKNGNIYVAEYKNGKKYKVFTIDKEGNPVCTKQYDKNGVLKYSKDASTGTSKKYEYNENGKLSETISYNAKGKKVSSEKYLDQDASEIYGDQKGYLVKEKTLYDEKGNVSEYRKIDYYTSDKNEIVKEVKSYSDEGKSNLLSTTTYVQDSYGNTNQKTVEDSDGKISKTEYKFFSNYKGKIAVPSGYSEVIETTGNKVITSKYINGSVAQKQIDILEDGKAKKTTTYEYTYYPNSNNQIKQVKKTDKNGNSIVYNYNINNSGSKTYIYKNKIQVTEKVDESRNKITLESEYISKKLNLYAKANASSSNEEKQYLNERINVLNKTYQEDIDKLETKTEEDYIKQSKFASNIEKAKSQLDYDYNKNRIKLLRTLVNTLDLDEINQINESLNQLYKKYLENVKNL